MTLLNVRSTIAPLWPISEIYFDPASGFGSKANALLLEYNQKKAQEAWEPRPWAVLFGVFLLKLPCCWITISTRGWSWVMNSVCKIFLFRVWCIPTNGRSLESGTVEVIRTVPQSYRIYLHHLHKDGRISLNSHWMACARTYRISNINFRRSSTRWRNNKAPSFGLCALALSGCHTGILMRPNNISFWLKGARQGTNSLMLHFGKQHRWWTEKWLEPQTMHAVFLAHWLTQTQLQYNEEMKELQVYVSILTWRWFHRLHVQLFPNPHVCGDYPIQHECSKLRGVTIWSLFAMNFVKVLIVQMVTVRFCF